MKKKPFKDLNSSLLRYDLNSTSDIYLSDLTGKGEFVVSLRSLAGPSLVKLPSHGTTSNPKECCKHKGF